MISPLTLPLQAAKVSMDYFIILIFLLSCTLVLKVACEELEGAVWCFRLRWDGASRMSHTRGWMCQSFGHMGTCGDLDSRGRESLRNPATGNGSTQFTLWVGRWVGHLS